MKIRCKIDPTAEEPELLVIAPARTAAVDALLSRLAQCAAPPITAYDGQRALAAAMRSNPPFFCRWERCLCANCRWRLHGPCPVI